MRCASNVYAWEWYGWRGRSSIGHSSVCSNRIVSGGFYESKSKCFHDRRVNTKRKIPITRGATATWTVIESNQNGVRLSIAFRGNEIGVYGLLSEKPWKRTYRTYKCIRVRTRREMRVCRACTLYTLIGTQRIGFLFTTAVKCKWEPINIAPHARRSYHFPRAHLIRVKDLTSAHRSENYEIGFIRTALPWRSNDHLQWSQVRGTLQRLVRHNVADTRVRVCVCYDFKCDERTTLTHAWPGTAEVTRVYR